MTAPAVTTKGVVPRPGWEELAAIGVARRFFRSVGVYAMWVGYSGLESIYIPTGQAGCWASVFARGRPIDVAHPSSVGFPDYGEAMDAAEDVVRQELTSYVSELGGRVEWRSNERIAAHPPEVKR